MLSSVSALPDTERMYIRRKIIRTTVYASLSLLALGSFCATAALDDAPKQTLEINYSATTHP